MDLSQSPQLFSPSQLPSPPYTYAPARLSLADEQQQQEQHQRMPDYARPRYATSTTASEDDDGRDEDVESEQQRQGREQHYECGCELWDRCRRRCRGCGYDHEYEDVDACGRGECGGQRKRRKGMGQRKAEQQSELVNVYYPSPPDTTACLRRCAVLPILSEGEGGDGDEEQDEDKESDESDVDEDGEAEEAQMSLLVSNQETRMMPMMPLSPPASHSRHTMELPHTDEEEACEEIESQGQQDDQGKIEDDFAMTIDHNGGFPADFDLPSLQQPEPLSPVSPDLPFAISPSCASSQDLPAFSSTVESTSLLDFSITPPWSFSDELPLNASFSPPSASPLSFCPELSPPSSSSSSPSSSRSSSGDADDLRRFGYADPDAGTDTANDSVQWHILSGIPPDSPPFIVNADYPVTGVTGATSDDGGVRHHIARHYHHPMLVYPPSSYPSSSLSECQMPSPYTHTGSLTSSPPSFSFHDLTDQVSSTKSRHASSPGVTALALSPVIDLSEDEDEDKDSKDDGVLVANTDIDMDMNMDLDIDSAQLLQSPSRRRLRLLPELEPVDDEQEKMLLQSPSCRPSCLLPELDDGQDSGPVSMFGCPSAPEPSSPPLLTSPSSSLSSSSLLSLPGANADDTLFPPTFALSPPALAPPEPPTPYQPQIPPFDPLSHERQHPQQLQHQHQQSPLLLVFSDPGDIPTSPSPPAEDFIELAPDLLLDASAAAAASTTTGSVGGETTTTGYPNLLLVRKNSGANLNLSLSLLEEKTTNPAELAQLAAVRKRAVAAERGARRAETRYREDGEHALCEQARAQRRRVKERAKEVEMLVRLKVGKRAGAGAGAGAGATGAAGVDVGMGASDMNDGETSVSDESDGGASSGEGMSPRVGDELKLQQLVAKMILRRRQSINTNGRKAVVMASNGIPVDPPKSPLSRFVTTDSSSLSSSKVPGKSTCAIQSQEFALRSGF